VSLYCIIFHRAEDKFEIIEGRPEFEPKGIKPLIFNDIDDAIGHIRRMRGYALSRQYDVVKVHSISPMGEIGRVERTLSLDFVEVENETAGRRIL